MSEPEVPANHDRAHGLGSIWMNPWLRFFIRRGWSLIAVVAALVVVVFAMVRLVPGNPAIQLLGDGATTQAIAKVNRELGLNGSLLGQFGRYLARLTHGDLGTSFTSGVPVTTIVKERIGSSAELAGGAFAVVMLVGVSVGMVAGGITQGGRAPRVQAGFSAVTSVFSSVPEYFTATILAVIFAVEAHVFPVSGSAGIDTLVLPVAAVSLAPTAFLARVVRVETVNVLSQDYIRSAHSQRLPARTVYLKHVLPNVLTASMTIAGLVFATIIGGAMIVENVFGRAGLGTELVNAVIAKDYPVATGIILVLGVAVVVINLLVDIVIALIDPRSLARHV